MAYTYTFDTSKYPTLEGEKNTRSITVFLTPSETEFLKNWIKVKKFNTQSDLLRSSFQTLAKVEGVELPEGYLSDRVSGPIRKLTLEQIEQIKEKKLNGLSLSEIAKEYSIDPSTVSLLINQKRRAGEIAEEADPGVLNPSNYPDISQQKNTVAIMLLVTPSEKNFVKDWVEASNRREFADISRDAVKALANSENIELPQGYFDWKFTARKPKITPEQIIEAKARLAKGGVTVSQLAQELDVTQAYMTMLLQGKRMGNYKIRLLKNDVLRVIALIEAGKTNEEIAEQFNIKPVEVEQIRRGDLYSSKVR